jgi:hypothetical protein
MERFSLAGRILRKNEFHSPTRIADSVRTHLVTIDQLLAGLCCIMGVMKAEKEAAFAVRCPTCGAKPREKCELGTGQPRTEPHPARRLAAEEK